jgi:ABC-type polysaccharide/polyol phosphate transport system ATPase subunit
VNENSVEVHNVSKVYQIGAKQQTKSIKQAAWESLRAPFKRTRSLLTNRLPTDADEKLWALHDVSFNVKQGETFGLIGINGSGKSTMMKIISNVVHPTTGYVKTWGRIGALLEVGAGFQMDLTGRDNIYLKGALLGMSREEIRRREDEIIEFSELEGFLDTPMKRYSSGMRIRLGFSIISRMEPDILIIDEAFVVGDVRFREKSVRELERFHRDGKTVLVISHSSRYMRRLCDRVVWLDRGRAVMMGPVDPVMDAYEKATVGQLPPIDQAAIAKKQDAKKREAERLRNKERIRQEKLREKERLKQEKEREKAERETFQPSATFEAGADEAAAAYIHEARLLNEAGQPATEHDGDAEFSIDVTYTVRQPFTGHLIAFIHDYKTQFRVLCVGDADTDLTMREERPPGTYRTRLKIPAGLFNQGQYAVTLTLGDPYIKVTHRVEYALCFEIKEPENPRLTWYKGRGRPGALNIDLPWQQLTPVSMGETSEE